ncbi:hypothetical protein B0J11DRAFT_26001 [Dendryphion nanum]|uniref:Uncharacterized protein n=1 Tax=Dendryphion nanum TaxID=256645 RepID=A0A9P9J1L7_9PLEO|nr:hypothetical protein B0J11DRAFT_26001 [Dendryphion nanum]
MNEIENENPNARRGERETVWAGSQTAAARGAMGLVERGRSGEEATNCRRDPGWGEMYVGDRCFATKVWLFQARELANFLWILDGRSRSGDEENCKNSGFGRLDPSSPAPQGAWLLFPLRTPPDHGSSSRFRGLSTACRLPHLFASIGPLVPAEYSFCVHCSEDEIDGLVNTMSSARQVDEENGMYLHNSRYPLQNESSDSDVRNFGFRVSPQYLSNSCLC